MIFGDRKIIEELKEKIKYQESVILNLRNEVTDLKNQKEENTKTIKEIIEINHKLHNILEGKKYIQDENIKLHENIKQLENKLKEYNPNLKPKKQKITIEEIELIKKLYQQEYTYREIRSKTGWSLKTISKAINNQYDK